jgi:hypothetical protein
MILVLGALALPVWAQDDASKADKGGDKDKAESGPPIKEYTVAALTTMLVMVVVCKPSRSRG